MLRMMRLPRASETRLLAALKRSLLLWERPGSAALLTGLVALMIASTAGSPLQVTDRAFYNYLADAFLHGQLHFRLMPPQTLDLSLFEGRYYLYFGPLPAVFLMPVVAVLGVSASDILQTIVLTGVNAGLFALLLRRAGERGLVELSPGRRAAFSACFALGSPLLAIASVGTVHMIAQLFAIAFGLLAFLAAFSYTGRKAALLVGMALGAIALSRLSSAALGIFPVWYLLYRSRKDGPRRLAGLLAAVTAPAAAAVGLAMAYNAARFGSPVETGFSYHLAGPGYISLMAQYGLFHAHYIPINIFLQYLSYPFAPGRDWVDGRGGSLFLLTPLLFAALWSLWQDRRSPHTWALAAAVLVTSLPSLFIMAPGTFQFGPRYTLDFAPAIWLLAAAGARRWPVWLIVLLTLISILHYLVGSIMFTHAYLGAILVAVP